MGKRNRPTRKQIELIASWGIRVPPTRNACSRLISYILNGNGTVGQEVGARVNLARDFEREWLGKIVCHQRKGPGYVLYLIALSKEAVATRKAYLASLDRDTVVAPFAGVVMYRDHPEQPTMFCKLTPTEPHE